MNSFIKRVLNGLLVRSAKFFPDKLYLQLKYRIKMGEKLNLDNPRTFNEKLQWLKLYNHNPEYCKMVDKYSAKDYVASIIGKEYIIPTFCVWDSFDDIDYDILPRKFVLKSTNGGGGGGVVICRDKNTFDKEDARKRINSSLKTDIYLTQREWPYKGMKHRIIAEELLEDPKVGASKKGITDYKFFCFDGEPFMMYISNDVAEDAHTDFFDMDLNRLNMHMRDPNSLVPPSIPDNFEEMRALAKKLSQNMPHVRVDFYNIDGHIYFGELTFFHNSGFVPIIPREWDEKLGDMISLPQKQV